MLLQKKLFMLSPDDETEGANIPSNSNDDMKTEDQISSEPKEKPSLLKKIKDALQDWSNDDQREQQIDDTRP